MLRRCFATSAMAFRIEVSLCGGNAFRRHWGTQSISCFLVIIRIITISVSVVCSTSYLVTVPARNPGGIPWLRLGVGQQQESQHKL